MENNVGNAHSHEKKASFGSTFTIDEKSLTENVSTFINHGAIAWHESRRKWLGDQSQKLQRVPKDLVISWSMTYDDLLLTGEPFAQRIPLPEMVDFLVDTWYDEGLYD